MLIGLSISLTADFVYEIEYEYLREHDGISKFNEILAHVNLTYEKNCITKLGRMLNSL